MGACIHSADKASIWRVQREVEETGREGERHTDRDKLPTAFQFSDPCNWPNHSLIIHLNFVF